jgi:DNA-binding GntR family transcriptional regulator
MAISSTDISNRIVEAVLAQKLAPGSRLGEQELALLFDCSRTIVREALTRLAARGIVTVSARRGWYLIEPSQDEAREAFEARRVIETGLIRQSASGVRKEALKRLKQHLQQEKAALRQDDIGKRSYLLGDFHVCLADCLGNSLLADTLRDYTARTTLIAMRYQSTHDAEQSCEDHVRIVEALMAEHIGTVQAALSVSTAPDPLARLREALAPVRAGGANPDAAATSAQLLRTTLPKAAARKRGAAGGPDSSDDSSTYLGKLL